MRIVIIGAGVAGLATGWRLAQAGQAVTILERGQPGSGATGAAAGMLAVTAELLEAGDVETAFARHSNDLWPDFAAELEASSGRGIGLSAPGALILASDATGLARLSGHSGILGETLDAAAVKARFPMLAGGFAGALWSPSEALVDSRALAAALAIAFVKAGGQLKLNEAAVRIEQGLAVRTAFGLYPADAVIAANGAWISDLVPGAAIVPVKGQMIALTPPAGEKPPAPVIWGNGIYMLARGGRLLVGATVEDRGFDTSTTEDARRDLRGRAEALMPSLRRWTLVDHWAGLRPRAPDGLPLLGPTATPGLHVAGGQFRNGILFAPALAENMAGQILGTAKMIPAFDPMRENR